MDYFPLWVRLAHYINIFCLVILARSGIQILMDHPRLYFGKDDSMPGSEWVKFGKKKMAKDRIWTSMDDAVAANKILALPGGFHNLGAGRNWHFVAVIVWTVTGFIYVGLLFLTGRWQVVIPTDPHVFAKAFETLVHYMQFQIPPKSDFVPYDALQQLAYFSVIFLISPLMMVTGLAMAPGFVGRFPGYLKIFAGSKQNARSLHFLGMIALAVFTVFHVVMVGLVYFPDNIRNITFGTQTIDVAPAVLMALAAFLVIVFFNVAISMYTLDNQRGVQRVLTRIFAPVSEFFLGRLPAKQNYTEKDITKYFWVNGLPPKDEGFAKMAADGFKNWRLEVGGLVEKPLSLSLDEIRAMPVSEQITKHNCIQGWTAVGGWKGVSMNELMQQCRPKPGAKYVVFHAYDLREENVYYYETLEMEAVKDPMTMLAYEMNGIVLPAEHGAPLRLRCERKWGYKMVKYLRAIEFVEDYRQIGDGLGGYREDKQYYDRVAAI